MTGHHVQSSSAFPVLIALALFALWTADAGAADFSAGDEVEVSGAHDDMVMAAGGRVRVNAQVRDDLFIAGGKITVTDTEADHLITAGGRLSLTGISVRDVIAAGGNLTLGAVRVADDVVISGGRVEIDTRSEVSGSTVVAGGEVELAGTFVGDVTAAGGTVRLDGHIGGNADLSARRLVIGPAAQIYGDLVHRAKKVEISPQARITGTVTARPYEDRLTRRDLFYRLIGVGVLAALAFIAGGIVLSAVLAGVLPGFMEATNATLRARALPSLGTGVLWAVGAPLAVAIFMVLVIGIPLGLFLLGVFALTFPLSGAVVSHFVGRMIRGRGREAPGTGGRVLWTLLGALIIALLGFVPILGLAVPLLIFLLGAGAAVLVFVGSRERAEAQAAG